MKTNVMRFIQANPNVSAKIVAEKFGLERKLTKTFDNGLQRFGYFKDGSLVMELMQ